MHQYRALLTAVFLVILASFIGCSRPGMDAPLVVDDGLAGAGPVGSECPEGQTLCDGNCRDLSSNAMHCGECNHACPGGSQCVNGTCTCQTGLSYCGDACVDTMADANNCGDCGNVCASMQICQDGECQCQTGLTECPSGCVDTMTDANNCGGCGIACVGTQGCTNGECTCAGGLLACPDGCVDPMTDVNNCGSCGNVCVSGQECQSGTCRCQAGLTECPSGCVDLNSDGDNCGSCGNVCASGMVCSQGACATSCADGLTQCGTDCVDLLTNSSHCGACDNACEAGQACTSGSCGCSAPLVECNGKCVNTQTDPNNCGACGVQCAAGEGCTDGECGCAEGELLCAGQCTDVSNNVLHCGACDNACSGGQSCVDGVCGCAAGEELCDEQCTDITSNVLHCGACNNACTGGRTRCVDGECLCPEGQDFCDGACIDTQSDPSNCGGCGNACAAGVECVDGVCAASCGDTDTRDPVWEPGYTPNQADVDRAQQKASDMDISAKIDQMHGYPDVEPYASGQGRAFSAPDDNTYQIRGFSYRDGPRGLRTLDSTEGIWPTCFPVAVARAATFDRQLERDVGEAIGRETLAAGHTVQLAPVINTLRHPGWGRGQETYGEDTFVLGKMGTAMTLGIQRYVCACPKHFAGNNIEDTRSSNNAVMDEQTLREIYARPFEMTVKEGGAACIMAAYNHLNGDFCAENHHLLTEILRDDWGFRGFVITDWGAAHNAVASANAGLNVEMPGFPVYRNLESAVPDQVPTDQITRLVEQILETKYRFNIGDIGGSPGLGSASGSDIGSQAHLDLAYETALKSMVLLKNEDNALPIDRSSVSTVALVGSDWSENWSTTDRGTYNTLTTARLGDEGSSKVTPDPNRVVAPLAGFQQRAGGVQITHGTSASVVSGADVAIVVAALSRDDEGEEWNNGGDRDTLELGNNQGSLISQVAQQHDRVIVILEASGPITGSWMNEVEAIVMAWYPGEQGGLAMADLLFGDANFEGRLPQTWPHSWSEGQALQNTSPQPQMDYFHGYRWFDENATSPLYPFGWGLSYTTFELTNLGIPCGTITEGGMMDVAVDVTNTGSVAGDTVVFLFVHFDNSSARRSVREIKGFRRVENLAPGDTQRVTIPLKIADLAYWSNSGWDIEHMEYTLEVALHAADDQALTGTFTVN